MGLGRLGAGRARAHAHDTARGALRHGAGPCDTTGGHGHDTIGLALGRWAQAPGRERACGCGRSARRARHSAQGRAAVGLRYGAGAPRHNSLRLQYGRAARPRYGHCARTWACLGAQLGQLGAYAPDSIFRPGFRLSTVFESPVGPGS